jgi:hypothetical protein
LNIPHPFAETKGESLARMRKGHIEIGIFIFLRLI